MTTHNAEINDGAIAKGSEGSALTLSAEVYNNSREALQTQRQIMQTGDTNGSVMENFGQVVFFDSQADAKNAEAAKESGRQITRDAQGRPTEVAGHKVHYGPDGQIDRVEFPKGWNYDGGDTYVKGSDGKWRDTKHNRVKEDFQVSTSKDGTLTVTEGNHKGTESRTYHPDGTMTSTDYERERGYTSVTSHDRSGRVTHEKVFNKNGEQIWDQPAGEKGRVITPVKKN